jgi:tetratricopeptide (TPR) repeat protein
LSTGHTDKAEHHHTEALIEALLRFLTRVLHWAEIVLAMFCGIVVLLGVYYLAIETVPFLGYLKEDGFHYKFKEVLSDLLLLAVSVELGIMLIRRDPKSVIELMFFVVARKMLIKAHDPFDILFGVIALAGLFAIRKYLEYVSYDFRRFQIEATQALMLPSDRAIQKVLDDWSMARSYIMNHRDQKFAQDVLNTVAQLMVIGGKKDEAERVFEAQIKIERESEHRRNIGRILMAYGEFLILSGAPEDAIAQFEEAIEHYRETRKKLGVSEALAGLGTAYLQLGDLEKAQEAFAEGLEVSSSVGFEPTMARNSAGLAEIDAIEGRPEEARAKLTEALELNRQDGKDPQIARDLIALSRLAIATGDLGAARDWIDQGIAHCRDKDLKRELAHTLAASSDWALREGQFDVAEHDLTEALELFRQYFDAPGEFEALRVEALLGGRREPGQVKQAVARFQRLKAEAEKLNMRQYGSRLDADIDWINQQAGAAG